ncbi:MAG TPA: pyridoxamine 5'-phosphate oxidase family protein [Victivallales bacterium]|nr:pyridoxamine 5'-phosphate oxidase family protein [Victivallales bacterium]
MKKKLSNIIEIERIIKKSIAFRLAMCDNNIPYLIPLCFGYKDNIIYFHSMNRGKKLKILKKNSKVCFEFDNDLRVISHAKACSWNMNFNSVVGTGTATLIEDIDEKKKALDIIVNQYSDKEYKYPDKVLNITSVFKIDIESISGRLSEYSNKTN